jgi:hypothetical protein
VGLLDYVLGLHWLISPAQRSLKYHGLIRLVFLLAAFLHVSFHFSFYFLP